MTRADIMGEFRQTVADPRHAINRVYDVHFVIDELERRNRTKGVLQGRMNLDEIAIAGHSFGAWTALAASGQQSGAGRTAGLQSADPRVKAAIYLSPPASKNGDPKTIYENIAIPGFTFTGTRDDSPVRDTKAEDRRIPYDNISRSDEYLVILDGADHMLFGGRPRAAKKPNDDQQQSLVQFESTRFLDAYLKHDAKVLHWLQDGGAARQIGSEGTFEFKSPTKPK
jgi:predicted dienelactone hydrolase